MTEAAFPAGTKRVSPIARASVGSRSSHAMLLAALVWLMPLQSMLFLPGFPYISPPAIIPALIGLALVAAGGRPVVSGAMGSRTALPGLIALFVVYTIVHGLFVDLWRGAVGEPMVIRGEFLRQLVSLLAGWMIYLYARMAICTVDTAWLLIHLRRSIVPHVLLALLAFVSMGIGFEGWDGLLGAARALLIPAAEAHIGFRATGLATEPSYLGIIIVAIYLPAAAAAWGSSGPTLRQLIFAAALLVAVIATASLTAFLVALAVTVQLLSRSKLALLAAAPLLAAASYGLVMVIGDTNNYALLQVSASLDILSGGDASSSLSFADTWYSYAGPLSSYDWKLLVGLGLGGTETHMSAVFPDAVAEMIRDAAEKDRISVLIARIFVEQGLIGFALFVAIWVRAWRMIHVPRRGAEPRCEVLLKAAAVGCVFGYLLKLGSFSLPYLWLYFAFVEVRYQRLSGRAAVA